MDLDAMHEQLFDLVRRALGAPDGQFGSTFGQLVASVEADFRREEELMDTFACADAHLHREQHARMLAGLHHAAAALEGGDPRPARAALAALHAWLPFHIDTLDRHLLRAVR